MSKEIKEILKEKPVLIGMLGAIGSGKSTLSVVLSENMDIPWIQESFPLNPYLERFYTDPKKFSFRSQLWFLESTIDQMLGMGKGLSEKSAILDPANEMNFLYAKTHHDLGWMSDAQYEAYRTRFKFLKEKHSIKTPDVFVWLYNPKIEIIEERIQKRARPYELSFFAKYPEYLPTMIQNILSFVHSAQGSSFIHVDLAEDYKQTVQSKGLLEKIKRNL